MRVMWIILAIADLETFISALIVLCSEQLPFKDHLNLQ